MGISKWVLYFAISIAVCSALTTAMEEPPSVMLKPSSAVHQLKLPFLKSHATAAEPAPNDREEAESDDHGHADAPSAAAGPKPGGDEYEGGGGSGWDDPVDPSKAAKAGPSLCEAQGPHEHHPGHVHLHGDEDDSIFT